MVCIVLFISHENRLEKNRPLFHSSGKAVEKKIVHEASVGVHLNNNPFIFERELNSPSECYIRLHSVHLLGLEALKLVIYCAVKS